MSASSSSSNDPTTRVPLLGVAATAGGSAYAQWRPLMQTHLMRQSIEARDYAKEIPQWASLVAVVEADAEAELQAAIDRVLGALPQSKGASSSSPAPTVVKADPDAEACAALALHSAAKKSIAAMIGRSRKAFAILHSALPAELRPLVADVPQGYAFGIWSFLEKKYRNTEQDSVAALWSDLTAMGQDSEENFDTYKARVDSVVELLTHAKQSVPSGLYTSIVMWKLRGGYATAVLTLKTSGKLTDTDTIAWPEIVTFMGQYERSQDGLGDAGGSDRVMAARGGRPTGGNAWSTPPTVSTTPSSSQHRERSKSPRPRGHTPLKDITCFNCWKLGHYADDCTAARRERPTNEQRPPKPSSNGSTPWQHRGRRRNGASPSNGSSDDESDRPTHKQPSGRANMLRTSNRFDTLDGHDDAVEQNAHPVSKPIVQYAGDHSFARSYVALALAATTLVSKKKSSSSSSPSSSSSAAGASSSAAAAASSSGSRPRISGPDAAPRASSKAKPKPLDELLKTTGKAIDTAATVSTTSCRESLHNLRRCMPMPIRMADGTVLSAMHKGDLMIRLPIADKPDQFAKVTINDVYFHERFDANLLSWGIMRKDGWEMHSTSAGTYLITPKGSRIDTSVRGNLTIIEDTAGERVYGARGARGIVCLTAKELLQLHRRLGHVSWSRLTEMCRIGATIGIGDIRAMPAAELAKAEHSIKRCAACAESKAHRKALGSHGLDKGTRAGEVLHMDTFYGSARNLTSGKKDTRYCLVAVDGFSEWRWSETRSSFKELPICAKDMIQHSHTMTGRYPRLLICDLGNEFNNGELRRFCKSIGTQWQPSPARAKEMNGIAEKNVGTMKNHAEAMMRAAGMSHSLGWSSAVNHFVYVWNRTHVGQHTGVTPHQSMTGRESSVLNLGEFGCDVYVHQHRSLRDTTFSPKAEPGIYFGHSGALNCPLVYVLRSGKIVQSRDVHFREGSFTHLRALSDGRVDDVEPFDLGADEPHSDSDDDLDDDDDRDERKYDEPPPSRTETIEDARKYTLKSIVDTRTHAGAKQFQCKWTGFPGSTWEPADVIQQDAPTAVAAYESLVSGRAAAVQTRRTTRSSAAKEVSFDTAVNGPSASSASDAEEDDSESDSSLAAAYAARRL